MLPLKFNKDSWHYKCAKFADFQDTDTVKRWDATEQAYKWISVRASICQYMRSVAIGMLVVLFLTAVSTLLIYAPIDGLIHLLNHTQMDGLGQLGCMIWASIIGLVCIIGMCRGVQYALEREPKTTGPKPPSFVKSAYHSWKDKVCVPVEFK